MMILSFGFARQNVTDHLIQLQWEQKAQGPYSRTSYDISWASDWSRWPSRPIRSLRYIITCTRIRALMLYEWKIRLFGSIRYSVKPVILCVIDLFNINGDVLLNKLMLNIVIFLVSRHFFIRLNIIIKLIQQTQDNIQCCLNVGA